MTNQNIIPGLTPYDEVVAKMESGMDQLPPTKDMLRMLHAAIGMGTEAGELLDQLKRHIFYGAPIDRLNIVEELGDSMWYIQLMANILGVSLPEIQAANVSKLLERYPDRFTSDNAINRDTKAEIDALKGNVTITPVDVPTAGEEVCDE